MRFNCFLLLIGLALVLGPGAAAEPTKQKRPTDRSAGSPAAAQPAAERPKQAPPRPSEDSAPVPGARAAFRKRDLNGDGLLDYDEMDDALRAERDRWDANEDGFIDFAEFTAYLRARHQLERDTARKGKPPAVELRARKPRGEPDPDLPKDLPPWFREYDTDGDGQIGLYEWKAAGQPLRRFREMDDNGDGFLTPDEVLAALPPKTDAKAKEPEQPKEPPRKERNDAAENAIRSLRSVMKEQVIQLDGERGMIIRTAK